MHCDKKTCILNLILKWKLSSNLQERAIHTNKIGLLDPQTNLHENAEKAELIINCEGL
jgi:hypothetical protein